MHRFGAQEHPDYSACKDLFTLKLYHGGSFDDLVTKYEGGRVDYVKLLKDDLEMENSRSYTFISDKQKGLINALEENCPNAEHRFYVMHLYRNMWKDHKGIALRMLLWAAARSTTDYFFDKNMNQLKKLNKKCYDWLIQKPKSQWSHSGFRVTSTSDIFVNNHCEVFNPAIRKFRHLPIITMLKEIHRGVMLRIQKRRQKMVENETIFCPNPLVKLQKAMAKSGECMAHWNGGGKFLVTTTIGGYELVVDMDTHTCACRKWQLSGVPCFHAIKCYRDRSINPEVGIHDTLTRRKYMQTYMHFIDPITGEEFWERTPYTKPLPPTIKAKPGRPRKNRSKKNDIVDADGNVHLRRQNISVTCGYCKNWGHNRKSCPAKANDTATREAEGGNVHAQEHAQQPFITQPPPVVIESQPVGSQPPPIQSQTNEVATGSTAATGGDRATTTAPTRGVRAKKGKRKVQPETAEKPGSKNKVYSMEERKKLLQPSE